MYGIKQMSTYKKGIAIIIAIILVIFGIIGQENVIHIKAVQKNVSTDSKNDNIYADEEIADINIKLMQKDIDVELELGKIPSDYNNIPTALMPETYGTCRTSFWGKMPNGGYQLVVYDKKLYVNYYDSSFSLTSSKILNLELPLWGGVYLGAENNYVVCGQKKNGSETDGGEVYRVIKYDKNFNRMDSISFNSVETFTSEPFYMGSMSLTENGGVLTVYTSRLRLDGHQSNIALRINTYDMTIANDSGMGACADILTSHSFRQIVKCDGTHVVYVDLSDGEPKRSVYLQSDYGDASLFDIAGQYGDNVTNTEVSGVEVSEKSYIVVGCALKNQAYNIFLSCYDKDEKDVTGQWLTGITPFDRKQLVSNAQIVKISENRFLVMWTVNGRQEKKSVNYVVVDEKGNTVSKLKEKEEAVLSDIEPFYEKDAVNWITINNGKILLKSITDFIEDGNYEAKFDYKEAENVWDGTSDTSWYSQNQTSFDISTPQQLAGLADLANQGNDFEGKTINLQNDIFLNELPLSTKYEWNSIAGCSSRDDKSYSFQGTFNGNGYTIYNIYISDKGKGGLFGRIGEKGIVTAVNVSQGWSFYGGIIAYCNEGIIQFCRNYSIAGKRDEYAVGGICNYNYKLLYCCQNYGEVWGSYVGGIVGVNGSVSRITNNQGDISTVNECSNHGLVEGSNEVAGIAGYNYTWIYNSYNVGLLHDNFDGINHARGIAGIVAENENGSPAIGGALQNCYSVCSFSFKNAWFFLDTMCHASNKDYVIDCYYNNDDISSIFAEEIDKETFHSKEFVDNLNIGTHNVMAAWSSDDNNINSGFPITVSDISYQSGIYKRLPELWVLEGKKEIRVDLAEQSYAFPISCYYNDSVPAVKLDSTKIGDVVYNGDENGGTITVQLKEIGTGIITINFPETGDIKHCSYQIELNVTNDKPVFTPKTTNEPVSAPKVTSTPSEKQKQTIIVEKQYTCTYGDEGFRVNAKSNVGGKISYTSENPDVVTVSEEGMVSIVAAGTTQIIVEADETENYTSAITKVKVVVSPCSILKCQAAFVRVGEFDDEEDDIEKYIILMDGEKVLKEDEDYQFIGTQLAYTSHKLQRGSFNIEGKGNYSGSNIWTLSPISEQPSLQSVTLTKKGVKLKWKEETGGVGYCIYRKVDNGKYKKIKTIEKNDVDTWLDETVLKNAGKYTYKIRIYTKNNGQMIYSKYSVSKSVQTVDMSIKVSGNAYYGNAFQVLELVNKEREKKGLSALIMDKELLSIAMQRASETNVYFSHTRPDGRDCFTAVPDNLLLSYGENIAVGQSLPTEVMNYWMNSSAHKANILDENNYNVVGIGCYRAGKKFYWVQIFGQKSSVDKATKSDYKDGQKMTTISIDLSLVSVKMSIPKKILKKGSSQKIQMNVINKKFLNDTIVLPNNQFTFYSSDKKVAKVSSKGIVKGYKKGKAKITAKFTNSGKTVDKMITVTVR